MNEPKTYTKIETLYNRSLEGDKKLIPGDYRSKTVRLLKDTTWIGTEKIDGTNIRVIWDGYSISFAGRTNKAVIPSFLNDKLIYKKDQSRDRTGIRTIVWRKRSNPVW